VGEGVAWASTLSSTLRIRFGSWVAHNATDMLVERLGSMYSSLPEIKVASDFQRVASDAFGLLPEARTETKYLLLAALAAASIRWFFILLTSRSILSCYGATKMMQKEE